MHYVQIAVGWVALLTSFWLGYSSFAIGTDKSAWRLHKLRIIAWGFLSLEISVFTIVNLLGWYWQELTWLVVLQVVAFFSHTITVDGFLSKNDETAMIDTSVAYMLCGCGLVMLAYPLFRLSDPGSVSDGVAWLGLTAGIIGLAMMLYWLLGDYPQETPRME